MSDLPTAAQQERAKWRANERADRAEALLRETAARAHKNGCRPIAEGWPFDYDWTKCRNQECLAILAALTETEPRP